MQLPHIYDIAELCYQKGVLHALISPGSRSAPLTLAFARHAHLITKVIPDERAAAFMALGLAQQTQTPVVLICTSGTAALNYAPAVAEAFFQEVPLIIITADRPPEWIDQKDGQTIRQQGLYGRHVKESYHLPDTYDHPDITWHLNRLVNEAINLALSDQQGPVHINVPLREPFYPATGEVISFDRSPRIIQKMQQQKSLSENDWDQLANLWNQSKKILLAVGQYHFYEDDRVMLSNHLERLSEAYHIPILADVISNLSVLPLAALEEEIAWVRFQDLILSEKEQASLSPDLLITFGQSFISKPFKQFLRKHPPTYHWHIQADGEVADTFQALTHWLPISPNAFLSGILTKLQFLKKKHAYKQQWYQSNQRAEQYTRDFFETSHQFTELAAVKEIVQHLPTQSKLHLANSMPVRYINYVGLPAHKGIHVFANRGTSGIDGTNSTAVGCAWESDTVVTILTGDMAFFYDRNAFWHPYLPANLRIIVLNNHGGGIFRIIQGAREQAELDTYFETEQSLSADALAKEFGMAYHLATDLDSLTAGLAGFFEKSAQPKLLEVATSSTTNAAIFEQFKELYVKREDSAI
ncbi:MAG: 2-succinyl-5-enolpyruvyl-6-hydroxy-3-cyclohexene-1-carboxylic-acid synthase [Bacteroidota bacterium]